jgi:hypothetical protein
MFLTEIKPRLSGIGVNIIYGRLQGLRTGPVNSVSHASRIRHFASSPPGWIPYLLRVQAP